MVLTSVLKWIQVNPQDKSGKHQGLGLIKPCRERPQTRPLFSLCFCAGSMVTTLDSFLLTCLSLSFRLQHSRGVGFLTSEGDRSELDPWLMFLGN